MKWLRRQDEQQESAELADPELGVEPGVETAVDGALDTPATSSTAVLIDSVDVPQPVSRAEVPAADPQAPSDGSAHSDGSTAASADERRQLIELLIYAWDRARSPGVWERLAAGLADVGVQVLRPDGEPFDPNAHEVGGTEPTDDATKVDTVAETEVAGFSDRGTVIREPVVVVYRRA